MIKKYLGLSLITASMLVMGCSSDDDGPATTGTTDGTTGTTDGTMEPTLVTVPAELVLPDPLPPGVVAPTLNIAELAGTVPELSSLLAAIGRTDLGTALSDSAQTFTVFAPTNAAFDALPAGTVDDLTAEELTALLSNHVVVGALDGALVGASAGSSVAMFGGENQAIVNDAGTLSLGGAVISDTDNYATNGIVHLIDSVILLPVEMPGTTTEMMGTTDESTGGVGTVEQLMIDNGTLGSYLTGLATTVNVQSFEDDSGLAWTVFAPTDAALAGAAVDNTIVQGSISVNGAYDLATLGARTEVTTNNGVSHAVVNNAGAITVGGFAVNLISAGNAVVYSIDGVLN